MMISPLQGYPTGALLPDSFEFRISGNRPRLEHPKQQQNNHYHDEQTQAAGWSIAPISAVRPGRNSAQQQNDQDY